MTVRIYYDGDCPFCSRYVRYLRLQAASGTPELINLRSAHEDRAALEKQGFDLDQGMVAEVDGQFYGGQDAVHVLALLSSSSGLFNRLNTLLFSIRWVALLVYPLLRAGRNATLFLLGRAPIQTESPQSREVFRFFSLLFGFFAVMHFAIYAFRFESGLYLSTVLILPLGLALFLWPGSRRLFLLLVMVMAIDAWLQAPMNSNHTILKNFFLLAILFSGLWVWLRGGRWQDFFEGFFPVGRSLLLIMYFFGVFHKINTDFINPEISCAVMLWREMPAWISMFDNAFVHYSGIYATFLIEILIVVCLLIPVLRHAGIVIGILFHAFLALSGYALFPTFSTISLMLHVLFLSPAAVSGIVHSPGFNAFWSRLHTPAGYLLALAWLLVFFLAAWARHFDGAAMIWLPLALGLLYLIVRYGRSRLRPPGFSLLWARPHWLNVVTLAFFFSCAAPYLGLKTAQSMNMFANLHLEGGYSNHLVLRQPPGPFTYLEDTVQILDASGSERLRRLQGQGRHMVYYDLLNELERHPEAVVTYIRGGSRYEKMSAARLEEDIDRLLHPRWFRKWFHFYVIDFEQPRLCRGGAVSRILSD